MAAPSTPTGFFCQQGNGNVYLLCDLTSTATSYKFYRSSDGVTYSQVGNPSIPYYSDTTATANTMYWYKAAATNTDGTSSQTTAVQVVPVATAALSLFEARKRAQQKADMTNSRFVTLEEWNHFIVQSYFELYDLLVTTYEDYFVQTPYSFTTDGSAQYTLQTDVYKLLGVDLGLSSGAQAWVPLKKFQFINRNKYVYPQMPTTVLGPFSLQYRLVGNTLMLIPTPSSGSTIRYWYIPKLTQPLAETDTLAGVSGWTEYVIIDAAIKALNKEESDVTMLMAEKMALIKRIEDAASNRDEGSPDTISDSRNNWNWGWGPDGSGAPSAGW